MSGITPAWWMRAPRISCKGAISRPSTSQRRPQWHGEHAVLARSGEHALVEKPMALSLDEIVAGLAASWRWTRRRRTRRRCSWCGSDGRRSRNRLPCRRIGWRRECRGLGDRQPATPHGYRAWRRFVDSRLTPGLGAPHEARADREPGCVRGHPCRPQRRQCRWRILR
jgi:hypothetical protein